MSVNRGLNETNFKYVSHIHCNYLNDYCYYRENIRSIVLSECDLNRDFPFWD